MLALCFRLRSTELRCVAAARAAWCLRPALLGASSCLTASFNWSAAQHAATALAGTPAAAPAGPDAASQLTAFSIPVFPVLAGDSSHGKRKLWQVEVIDRGGLGVIRSRHGYEGCKMVEGERVVAAGKNIGRKNATTPVQQAVSEARAMFNKKRDAGYVEAAGSSTGAGAGAATAGGAPLSAGSPPASGSSSSAAGSAAAGTQPPAGSADAPVPLPMLAQDYSKRGASIVFPAIAQRKLDGVRCLAVAGRGLFSRNGKPFPNLAHIRAEVDALPPGTLLDGELYGGGGSDGSAAPSAAHDHGIGFQALVGAVRREDVRTPEQRAAAASVRLCVYDVVREGGYAARRSWLEGLFAAHRFAALSLLPSESVASAADVPALHARYVAEGYEGLILRNVEGAYRTGFRSPDLQKYKTFADEEYPVTGFKEGDGVEKGCVIWLCRTPAGAEFAVRPRGTHAERIAALASAASRVGQQLTVRFQGLTSDGIPRFPVGVAFRDYE